MSQKDLNVISLASFGLHCIRPCAADLAVIFVHGILSDGDHAWGHPSWPNLLADEPEFGKAGIFVFTYQTGLWSHTYGIADVADYLRETLRHSKLLDIARLVFVCHSMGGIVVRRFLIANQRDLIKRKSAIGLFLVASPSLGSADANLLSVLSYALQHTQAASLRFSQANTSLDELNRDFWSLLSSHELSIEGRELTEDRAIPVKRWFGLRRQVVEPFSASQYFHKKGCEPFRVPGSDHQTIVKPQSASAIQHAMLLTFLRDEMIGPAKTDYAIPAMRRKISSSLDATHPHQGVHIGAGARSHRRFLPVIWSLAVLSAIALILYWLWPLVPNAKDVVSSPKDIGTYEVTITSQVQKRVEQAVSRDLGQFKGKNTRLYKNATPNIGWSWDLSKPLNLVQGSGESGRCEGIDMNASTEQGVSVFARLDEIKNLKYPFGADGYVSCSLSGTIYRMEPVNDLTTMTGSLSRMSDVIIDLPPNTTSFSLKLRTLDGRERVFGGSGGDDLFDIRRSDRALIIAPKGAS